MASADASTSVLHPASGILVLGLDWLFFAENMVTLGLSTPALALLGFGLAGLGTGFIQRRYRGDGRGAVVLKALLAGVAVGLPLPIAGTAVGGGVLALSGLDRWWGRAGPETPSPAPTDPDE